MVDGSLNFDTRVDTAGFSKGTNTIKGMANGLIGTFKKVGIALAGAFAVGKIVQVGKEAIGFASDLQEVQNVVDTAFGDMSYKMEDFAEKAIETYGISKLSAKQTGSTYMAMAKGMGLATDGASDMALALTGLSADMASFYNVEQEVAATALKSIFTGETETLKQYGIVMTETNLQEYAAAQGIKKKLSAMTQAEKVQLRYSYVMEQTALAQGDFAKTSGSWANQTRILQEQWKEFLGILGNGLIQVFTPVVRFLNTAMSQMIAFANTASTAVSKIFGLKKSTDSAAKSAAGIGNSAESAGTGMSEMAEEAADASKKINKSLSGFDDLNQITQNTADSAEAAAGGLGGMDIAGLDLGGASGEATMDDKISPVLDRMVEKMGQFQNYLKTVFGPGIDRFVSDIQPSIESFKSNLSGMFSDIQLLGQPFLEYLTTSFTPELQGIFLNLGVIAAGLFDSFDMVFADLWNLVVYPVLTTMIGTGLPMMTQFAGEMAATLRTLFTSVKAVFDLIWSEGVAPALALVVGIWQSCWDTVKRAWDKWGAPIFENVRTAIKKIGNTLQLWWENYMSPIWNTFMDVVGELWDEHLQPFVANFLDMIGEFVNGALTIYNEFISPVVDWFIKTFGPVISNVFQTAIRVIGSLLAGVIDVASGIITKFKGLIQFITGVFTGDWKKAWTGIKNIFKGTFDSFVAIVKTPVNMIIDIINGMISGIVAGVNTVIRAINSINLTVPDWIPGVGGSSIGFNLKEVVAPQVPKLATGAVIPPNREFLAILGDQKNGTNIEAPLELIVDALKQALAEFGINVDVHIEQSEDGTFRIVQQAARKYTSRTGNPAFPV